MDIYEEIQRRIRRMRDEGLTQQQISKLTGISQPFISQLLNPKDGAERVKHLELAKLMKLFPDAQIVFGGDRRIGDVHHNTNSPVIQGDGNTVAAQPSEETASAFLQRIMAAPDIDAETKVKIFNLHSRRPFN